MLICRILEVSSERIDNIAETYTEGYVNGDIAVFFGKDEKADSERMHRVKSGAWKSLKCLNKQVRHPVARGNKYTFAIRRNGQ